VIRLFFFWRPDLLLFRVDKIMIHATKTEGMQQSSQHFSILHPLSIEEVADFDDEGEEDSPSRILSARRTLWNFTLMSILFSANHGCVVGKKMTQKMEIPQVILFVGFQWLADFQSS
jgi:hypothetical protein